MQLLVTVLTFAAVVCLTYAGLALVFSEERRVTRALRSMSDWESRQAAEAEPLLQPFRKRVLSPAVQGASGALRSFLPANSRERAQHNLDLAGNPGALTPEGFFGFRVACMVGASVGAVVILLVTGVSSLVFAVLLAIAAIGGYLAPGIWLMEVRERRQARIVRALPDMLDMLTVSVQAGMGFDMSLAKLVANTTGPLAEEFGRMLNEVQAGASRRDAFRHLAERTEVPELSNFVMAMVQADVFGVSVSNVLHTQAGEMRLRRRQRAEEQAQKAPVKMVFPIVLCILPATMLVIAGPAALSIGRAFGIVP